MARTADSSTDTAPTEKKKRQVNPNRTPARRWAILTIKEGTVDVPELLVITKDANIILDLHDKLSGEGRPFVRQEIVETRKDAASAE